MEFVTQKSEREGEGGERENLSCNSQLSFPSGIFSLQLHLKEKTDRQNVTWMLMQKNTKIRMKSNQIKMNSRQYAHVLLYGTINDIMIK